jgi:hypothetical protein
LTVITRPTSEVPGDAIVSSVSLVLRRIADTPAGVGEEQLAALSRLLVRGNRIRNCAGNGSQDLIGTQQQGGTC